MGTYLRECPSPRKISANLWETCSGDSPARGVYGIYSKYAKRRTGGNRKCERTGDMRHSIGARYFRCPLDPAIYPNTARIARLCGFREIAHPDGARLQRPKQTRRRSDWRAVIAAYRLGGSRIRHHRGATNDGLHAARLLRLACAELAYPFPDQWVFNAVVFLYTDIPFLYQQHRR